MFKKGHPQFNTGRTHFKKGQIPWNKKSKIKKECLFCKKEFLIHPCRKNIAKYCSKKCMDKSKIGSIGYWLNKKRSQKTIEKISKSRTGIMMGENHHNWKGGITPKNKAIRDSAKYLNWRKKIFKRDNWTCQECKQRGGDLEVHHIKKFIKYPKLRFKVSNGITLCKECHRLTKLKSYTIDAD